MGGTIDKTKGTLKEVAGKATGDKRLETEGKVDQVKGEAKNAAEDASETLKGTRDSLEK